MYMRLADDVDVDRNIEDTFGMNGLAADLQMCAAVLSIQMRLLPLPSPPSPLRSACRKTRGIGWMGAEDVGAQVVVQSRRRRRRRRV